MRPCTILLLDSQDSFGNARTTGGDAVTFAVTAPNGEVSMLAQGAGVGQWEDPGDGSYHAVSQFTMSGEYEVDVGVGGFSREGETPRRFSSSRRHRAPTASKPT